MAKREPIALIPGDGPLDPASLTQASREMLLNAQTADASGPTVAIGSIELMQRMTGSQRVGFVVWETSFGCR